MLCTVWRASSAIDLRRPDVNKFTQGQIINFKGANHRIRLVAKAGFEGSELPVFYDLINLETKDKTVESIELVDALATLHQEAANESTK